MAVLEANLEQQDETIAKHQLFLGSLDRKERGSSLIITMGVPDEDEGLDGAITDSNKVNKIWSVMRVVAMDGTHRRLEHRTCLASVRLSRHITILRLRGKTIRGHILDLAKNLKNGSEQFKKVYVTKDVRPSVRKCWQGLRDAERAEEERPENNGHVVRLDTRDRKLYRDGCVIDSWTSHIFL